MKKINGSAASALRSALLLAGLCLSVGSARANDAMFPPSDAARPFIRFDERGFLVNGKRTFLTSGGIEYARVPHAQWRDRLMRFKRAGFNTVEMYNFWNAHEPQEGKFDFAGDHDLDAFLKLIKELGMYAICRVGPYYCAEWDSGGYPIWLRFKPGVRVREDNPEFEKYVDRFLDKIMPIIASNQINRGGSVIMVQLENEHPQGWGTEMPNGYFRHLREKAVALGLEVPYFFSGLHHGSDPAGDNPWDSKRRPGPWFTTEFWPGWYSDYGPLNAGDFRRFDRGDWKILAYGGNGYNFYMLHGGTNFGYTNNNEDASSYDYGAAVGQTGDLRPIYYRFKRTAWFARGFQDILEDSENATDAFQGAATAGGVRVTARKSPVGTILFLDNNSNTPIKTQVKGPDGKVYPEAGPTTLAAGEIMPIVENAPLTGHIRLVLAASRILGVDRAGDTTTLVAYGPAGEPGELRFDAPPGAKTMGAGSVWSTMGTQQTLTLTYPTTGPAEYQLIAGKEQVRVIAVSEELADRTWFVPEGDKTYIVCGPHYIGEVMEKSGRLQGTIERPVDTATFPITVFGPDMEGKLAKFTTSRARKAKTPTLSPWEARTAPEVQADYAATAWLHSETPLQMGADGDDSAYAWYRTTLNAPAAGRYALSFAHGGDKLFAFLDGSRLPDTDTKANSVQIDLTAGNHALTLFAAHYGRDKLFGYLGALDTVDAKGVMGPATLRLAGSGVPVAGWRVKKAENGSEAVPAGDAVGWNDTQTGKDVFNSRRGFAWYQATLPASAAKHKWLHFETVDDNGAVYLNGLKLASHTGYKDAFDVMLDTAWRNEGPNVLTVLVENTDGPGGIMGPVTLTSYDNEGAVTGWSMRGGPFDPAAAPVWKPLGAPSDGASGPRMFRARFNARRPTIKGTHTILRIVMTGMSAGFVWLNGHNLGRYPEKVPVNGLYLPESWLQAGKNTIMVFDEEGKSPHQVALMEEKAASRIVQEMLP